MGVGNEACNLETLKRQRHVAMRIENAQSSLVGEGKEYKTIKVEKRQKKGWGTTISNIALCTSIWIGEGVEKGQRWLWEQLKRRQGQARVWNDRGAFGAMRVAE